MITVKDLYELIDLQEREQIIIRLGEKEIEIKKLNELFSDFVVEKFYFDKSKQCYVLSVLEKTEFVKKEPG